MTGLHAALLALVLTGAGADEPVLLDFSTAGCLPCRQMEPVVDRLIAEGYAIRKVRAQQEPELARRFGVSMFPCFVMTVGGREIDRVYGAGPARQLQDMFHKARSLSQPKLLPEPGELPRQDPGSTPRAIPLPHQPSNAALAMETPQRNTIARNVPISTAGPSSGQVPIVHANIKRGLTDTDLIAATVRLRVHDQLGSGIGTGTIIDSREGRALILTCGHIFREYREGGKIEVDLFGPNGKETVAGRLLSFDDDRDVGLLTIQVSGPVQTIPVAPRGYSIGVGATVANVGCNHGDDPSVRHNKVTALNRYGGAANIEVAGLPVQGRSGGGLISADGYIVGVCNAADPESNEGLYAALASIHHQLDEVNLEFVYSERSKTPVLQASMVAVDEPTLSKSMPAAEPVQHLTETRDNAPAPLLHKGLAAPLTVEEQRLLEELRRRRSEGAEIICIIRTKEDPDARSEVFLFENASPRLVEQLDAEGFSRR